MREMLALQPRFAVTRGKRAIKLLEHRRFRAAYDFMMLRRRSRAGRRGTGGVLDRSADAIAAEERAKSFQLQNTAGAKKRRRRRRRRAQAAASK